MSKVNIAKQCLGEDLSVKGLEPQKICKLCNVNLSGVLGGGENFCFATVSMSRCWKGKRINKNVGFDALLRLTPFRGRGLDIASQC